ncbi:MAG: NADH-ubiquinone oxidoreductase-F iron-sulfur binding region domain-containing protein [Solirubrobacteraceae bacterium]
MSLPRLLLGVGAQSMDHHTHVQTHGDLPATKRTGSGLPSVLAAEIGRSGLRGRGGGAFPLAKKLELVARGRGRPIVVVNATEGEPMSVKDRMLLESLPHLVLDGAFSLAAALDTPDVIVAVDEAAVSAADSLRAALQERPDVGRRMIEPRIVSVPSGYVAGQETAIVNFVNKGVPRPLTQPPRIAERGISRRPTLMSNAETLAHVALIARHGADWFRELGPADEPGSLLITLSGGVGTPGVYEVEFGSHLRSLIDAADGLTEPARAFLFGGYAGSWVDARAASDARLSQHSLRSMRATMGAGIVVALPQSACPVTEVARVAAWMFDQSAHQCGPCLNGLASISEALAAVRDGHARRDAFGDIRRWAELVIGRGACTHPDGTARFVTSALAVFSAEFDDHARHGACEACDRRPVLITPRQTSPVS